MKNLKVLMLNGSPHANGNTAVALREMEKVFMENGVAVETVLVGDKALRGCAACNGCKKTGKCVFDDVVNDVSPKFEAADGLVVASPVYYASANATLIACLDRLFYSSSFDKTMKVGASIACARRGGCSATFDELNQVFCDLRHADRAQPVLEQHPRLHTGRGRGRRRRKADHACARSQHDLFDAEHRAGKRAVRPS